MTTHLESKSVIAWHRAEAKKHQEIADFHNRTAEIIETGSLVNRHIQAFENEEEPPMLALNEDVTLNQLEEELQAHGGRISHLASRLNTTEVVIETLLNDPKCQYVVGPRGFIYHKGNVPE